MAKSDIHSESSAKRFGGRPEDYLEIHELMDSSKAFCADNRHRVLFHSTAGAFYVQKMFGIDFSALERLREKYNLPHSFISDFLDLLAHNRSRGVHIVNSDNQKVHLRNIAEQHILEDFRNRFIPTLEDYLKEMQLASWMDNALGSPRSAETKSLREVQTQAFIPVD